MNNTSTNQITISLSCYQFMLACRVKSFSEHTLKSYQRGLNVFMQWCEDRDVIHPDTLATQQLNSYRRSIYYRKDKHGKPLKPAAQTSYLTPVRSLFIWLVEQGHLINNPASSMDMPRCRQELPKNLLSTTEMDAVIAQVDVTAPLGLRDRALLELAYSTGLRRSELAHLSVRDVQLSSGWVFVREGKGGKDRRVPIGERACLWLKKYLADQRPYLLVDKNETALFIHYQGRTISADKVYRVMHHYIEQVGKQGGSHLFRHAMATHMLEQGADIRYIQQMLGHSQLTSTQIYTQVEDRQLKIVHNQTHPAQMRRHLTD